MSEDTRKEEFDTIQRQIAGVGDAKISLLGEAEEEQSPQGRERRRARERQQMSALKMLLRDNPDYAALYAGAISTLGQYEAATASAIDEWTQKVADTSAELDEARASANRLPDGSLVFRNEDGEAVDENGNAIDEELAASVIWKDDAPTYEEYLAKKQAADEAQRTLIELERYQVEVLGAARETLTNEDKPPSAEEISDLEEALKEKAPEAVSALAESSGQESNVSYKNAAVPDLSI